MQDDESSTISSALLAKYKVLLVMLSFQQRGFRVNTVIPRTKAIHTEYRLHIEILSQHVQLQRVPAQDEEIGKGPLCIRLSLRVFFRSDLENQLITVDCEKM